MIQLANVEPIIFCYYDLFIFLFLIDFAYLGHACNQSYHQFSNISRTQSQNTKVSRLVLQLSLPNPLKPGVKLRMKM